MYESKKTSFYSLPKEVRKFIRTQNIITNNYCVPAYDLIMCRYFCSGFIDFMLKVRRS